MKSIFEEHGGTYHFEGDYLLPDLTLPDDAGQTIGFWGRLHEKWLMQEHRALYNNLKYTYRLHAHLVDVDRRAERMVSQLTAEMEKRENVSEALKAVDQMEWVRRMNSIRTRVRETVFSDIIFSI